LTGREPKGHESALLRAVGAGDARLFAIFGGQGYEDYFDELTSLYSTYSVFVGDFIQHVASHLLKLSMTEEATKVYGKGLDIMSWILTPQDRPDGEYLCSAPVSLPGVGIVQLALYAVTCRVLGKDPGVLREYFSGMHLLGLADRRHYGSFSRHYHGRSYFRFFRLAVVPGPVPNCSDNAFPHWASFPDGIPSHHPSSRDSRRRFVQQ